MTASTKSSHERTSFSQKRPVISVILIELLLLIAVFIAGAYATLNELSYTTPVLLSFIPISIVLIIYITIKRKWRHYGFRSLLTITKRSWIYYLPQLAVLIVVAFNGFKAFTLQDLLFFLFFTLLVAFVEETIYRGLILQILLRSKGIMAAVITSSILFSVTHVLNMLSGQSAADTIMQLAYALLTGAALALLMVKNGNIIPLILFHFIHNLMQFLGNEGRGTSAWDYVVILILLAQCIWLIPDLRKKPSLLQHASDQPEHTY
ncbi:hypothetical protein FHS19_002806 [Paenibacillus rhizosphaerae]|uniref:CAAX prenyl protease 2/Lysostaphin resistance protein A-like domain-containing protein n=1 Tax=Paenibacillus rhizosphaerae TaxID=297318 RepID=A0A839TNA8_9BACL|nr:CPBP family intramembrane glutamic endopeptidase [Paenibacillus rhizosphaerae]MBB3128152.1 hypothetical protein [Paenibacillus rhizosphaerae]